MTKPWSVLAVVASLAVVSCSADASPPVAAEITTTTEATTTVPNASATNRIPAAPTTLAAPAPATALTQPGVNASADRDLDAEPDAAADEFPATYPGTDDPLLELGPPVELDVDLARFPVDDAGLGGSPPPNSGDSTATNGAGGALPDDAGAARTGWAAFDRSLEAALIRPGNTAASVAVSIDGDVVHAAAFGVRDPARGEPVDPNDRFRIASISKPITAIVVMALVADGLVALDDPVGGLVADHLAGQLADGSVAPDSTLRVSASARSLTLRQLLTHRSGFGKFDSTFFGGAADDCDDAARRGLTSGAGGGGYVYSNMNYCIAGLAIEAITGLSYEDAVYRYLLTPLGISGMRMPPTIDPGPDEVQHRTTLGRNYMETLGAAGAWIATPTDLVTIMDALDLDTPGFKPLDQRSVFEIVTPVGGQYGQQGYGIGIISYGAGRFGHTGTIEATHAMVLNRGDGVTWAVTVAGDNVRDSTDLERLVNAAFAAGGFTTG
ncbi:MAG: serine hydrolase domain-containing protein [Ilumatobacter sp.]|uniref:serine hydrolase domain-containing protein n=1 Tax=Ilumatobacter sp. TaxID=1967498 RepID=UPI003919DA92